MSNLPHVYKNISFPTALKRLELEFFQSLVVWKVLVSFDSLGEVLLD